MSQAHLMRVCTGFAVIVFGDITGSWTVLLILQRYTRKSYLKVK
ncbi:MULTISPECIES: hypothetical protein [Priestia]|nr:MULTISPECIES: hypothetical protein [Priestia]